MTLSSVCIRYQFMNTVRRLSLFLLTLLKHRQLILLKYCWSTCKLVWKWSEPSWDVGLFPLSLARLALRTVLACSCPVPRSVSPTCLCSEPLLLPLEPGNPFTTVNTDRQYCTFLAASLCLSFTSVYMVCFFFIFELTDRVLLCFVLFSSTCKCCKTNVYIWF